MMGNASAEGDDAEISEQERSVDLRLYDDTEQLLTPDLTYGAGNSVTLAPTDDVNFLLDEALFTDMKLKAVDGSGELGARFLFWAYRAYSGGDAELEVTLMDGGTEIAFDTETVTALFVSDPYTAELEWDTAYEVAKEYDLEEGDRLELVIHNNGPSDVTIEYDDDNNARTRVQTLCQSVRRIEISTEAPDLNTNDDRMDSEHFEPNLPADFASLFVWGHEDDPDTDLLGGVLDAFGSDNVAEVWVMVYREGEQDDPYYEEESTLSDSDSEGWKNYELMEWDYSEESLDWGSHYRVETLVKDIQDNEFNRIVDITMDQYGAYLYLPDDDPSGEIAVGGSREFNFKVRNTGGDSDTITVTPSGFPNNWTILPESDELALNPGQEKDSVFTLFAPDDPEFVNEEALVKFTASSDGASSVQPKEFELTTATTVGAQYDVELFYRDGDTILHDISVSAQMAKPNEFNFTLANLGQDTDDFEVEGIWPGDIADWKVDVYRDDHGARDNPFLVEDVPRKDQDFPEQNEAQLMVVVEPATGGDAETAMLTLKATSQGNTSVSHSIYMNITRSKGVTLRPSSPGGNYRSNAIPDSQVTFDLVIESSQADSHTYQLTSQLPSGLSGKFTDVQGGSLIDISLEKDETQGLKFVVDDLPSDITYKDGGYVISLLAEDVEDSDVKFQLSVSFNIAQDVKFSISVKTSRVEGTPDETVSFELDITNDGNTADTFIVSLNSGPSGYDVSFKPKSSVFIEAGESESLTIRVSIPDDAVNGDKVELVIEVSATDTDQTQTKKLKIEVEADFQERMMQVLENNWYLLLLIPLLVIGYVAWSRNIAYEEEDDDYDTGSSASDDFEDWD